MHMKTVAVGAGVGVRVIRLSLDRHMHEGHA